MKKLFIAIILASIFCSCHHDDDPECDLDQRTVLVYMAAENNLSSFAYEDIEEMKNGSLLINDKQNLILYVDRAHATTTPFLVRVKGGELVDTLFMEEGLAADPTVMGNVIRKTKELYPARSYGLVLWGHASGWIISEEDSISVVKSRAYGGSTGNNSSSGSGNYWMNIPQMKNAISRAMGDEKLKFIFGDCCSFACVEVAHELRSVTDYVIGSPAEIPDMGAPYHLIVPELFDETESFYRTIIDHYYNYYLAEFENRPNYFYNKTTGDLIGYSVPLAAIKTDELQQLGIATNKLLQTISDKVSTTGQLDLDNIIYYAQYMSDRYSYDMYYTLKRNTSAQDFNTWASAYNKAVPYHRHSEKWMSNSSQLVYAMEHFNVSESECGDISMFFPGNYYSTTKPNWNKAIQLYEWNDIINWQQYGW